MDTHVLSKYINLYCKLNYSFSLATATTLLENFRTKRRIFDNLAANTIQSHRNIGKWRMTLYNTPASSTFTRLVDIGIRQYLPEKHLKMFEFDTRVTRLH